MICNLIVQYTNYTNAHLLEITLLKQSLPIIVVILILTVVYFINLTTSQDKNDSLKANQCYLVSYACELKVDNNSFNVEFDRFPLEVEEMTKITFSHSSDYLFDSGWVEGTNMFMGKMKLFTSSITKQDSNAQIKLELFLGACSEPQMRWKLVLNLTHLESGKSQRIIVFFQTNQS